MVFLLLWVIGSADSFGQGNAAGSVFQPGEELAYNVTYAGINLGQIRLRMTDTVAPDGTPVFRARALIDSYKSVPFVELHTVYESRIAPEGYSEWFLSRTKRDDRWVVYTYHFDYQDRQLRLEQTDNRSADVLRRDTLKLDTLTQDGLSVLYCARKFLQPGADIRFPAVVSEKKGYAKISVAQSREHETIDAIDYPVRLIHFTGKASFVGVYGFTGEFEGWFSDDSARVPVIAKLNVVIGSIRLELMKWKRTGWVPPRYTEE